MLETVDIYAPLKWRLQKESCLWDRNYLVGGNSNIFGIFTPKIGEDSQFDSYFSDGLKPPTSYRNSWPFRDHSTKGSRFNKSLLSSFRKKKSKDFFHRQILRMEHFTNTKNRGQRRIFLHLLPFNDPVFGKLNRPVQPLRCLGLKDHVIFFIFWVKEIRFQQSGPQKANYNK